MRRSELSGNPMAVSNKTYNWLTLYKGGLTGSIWDIYRTKTHKRVPLMQK